MKFGDHIEHAYHALALDEKRGFFSPTLWESGNELDCHHFEQCWMVGDHSNVGGSWDDQQLADISLAWMMSRYESLGVKFNQRYVYDQYVKYKTANKARGWGEGQSICSPTVSTNAQC